MLFLFFSFACEVAGGSAHT